MMIDAKKVLMEIGFNKKEANVYLASLELAEATITDIAQKAGIPRTTAYGIIKILAGKGLVSFNVKKRRKYFFAEDPMRLLSVIRERKTLLKEMMPRLLSIRNIHESKPKIKFYEGKEGVKNILEDILKTKKDFLAITAIKDMNYVFDKAFPAFISERSKKGIKVGLLTDKNQESLKLSEKDKLELRETKFIPEGFSFHTANFIYGDKVAIISPKKQPIMGIIIEDSGVANTQKILFEIIWNR